MRLFIIDDNELHREMIRLFADSEGHECTGFDSLDAVKQSRTPMPDIAFIDYHLDSKDDGISVLHHLKSTHPDAQTLYVALTADLAERVKLEKAGFSHVLFKPINKQAFLTFLNTRRT